MALALLVSGGHTVGNIKLQVTSLTACRDELFKLPGFEYSYLEIWLIDFHKGGSKSTCLP